jgi:septum formation topological specificity factor MinE
VLNNRKITTAAGNLWGGSAVHFVLQNKSYIGVKTSRKYVSAPKTKRRKARPDELIIHENAFLPIVDAEIFDKVQATYSKKIKTVSPPKDVFTKKIYCQKCGKSLCRSEKYMSCGNKAVTGGERCFSGKIVIAALKTEVLAAVKAHIGAELSRHKSRFSFSDKHKLETEIAALKEKRAGIFERYAEEKITENEFIKLKNSVGAKIFELETALEKVNENTAWYSKNGGKESPFAKLKRLYEAAELTMEHLIFVKKIVVSDEENYEIQFEPDAVLTVLCRNVKLYEDEDYL